MKKRLQNNAKTQKYLSSLPKIYLVGFWAKYGVMSFPLVGWKNIQGEQIPLVYQYYDANGLCDEYILRTIFNTTSGGIVCWTTREVIARQIADGLNKLNERK